MAKQGVFSAKAKEVYGSVVWARPDGSEQEITSLFDDVVPDTYLDYWTDAVVVGEVTHWIRGALLAPRGLKKVVLE